MTVSSSTSKDLYTGNGSLAIYPYTFRILNQSEIRVTLDGVDQTLTTDYTVSGVGDASGGNITFVTAPVNLASIVLIRNMPFTQSVDYQENDSFPAETHETALDRHTMEIQQIKELQDRAFTLAEDQTTSTVIPDYVADNFLKVNGAGTVLEWGLPTAVSSLWTDVAGLAQTSTSIDMNSFNIQFDDASGISDDSGNEFIVFQKTTSAVNQFDITNAATGNAPLFSATGDDANISMTLSPKGTGTTDITSALTVKDSLTVDGSSTAAGKVVLGEDTDNGSNTFSLSAAAALAANVDLILPDADATLVGQSIESDASGTLSFGGTVIQHAIVTTASTATTTTVLPDDNTTPLNTEGAELFTMAFTARNATSNLMIEVFIPFVGIDAEIGFIGALFDDGVALSAGMSNEDFHSAGGFNRSKPFVLKYFFSPGDVASHTYSFRFGPGSAGTANVMLHDSAAAFNGFIQAHMQITELLP